MFDPILVTLLTIQPHYSQSSCENEPYPGAHPRKPVIRKYPPEKAWTLKTTIWLPANDSLQPVQAGGEGCTHATRKTANGDAIHRDWSFRQRVVNFAYVLLSRLP